MNDSKPDKKNKDKVLHRVNNMSLAASISEDEKEVMGIIYPGMAKSEILNIYRDLRNKLLRISDYENFVCLVSAIEEDGVSSLLTLNLAAVFAFDRSRSALIIDCDTSDNILDEITENESGMGLIDFIENDLDDVSVLIHDSGIDRLRIVPSGQVTETRTEALESLRMREIVLEFKNRYPDRYIIINAPSMSLSSEVQILSNISDMVIFEVLSTSIDKIQVTEAIEMIGPDKVAGIVFQQR